MRKEAGEGNKKVFPAKSRMEKMFSFVLLGPGVLFSVRSCLICVCVRLLYTYGIFFLFSFPRRLFVYFITVAPCVVRSQPF